MADILTLSRETLPTQAAQRLRTMIIEGAIAAGAKLNERTLCERLNISRTPLREAIRLLAAEGLVELLPQRGAVALALSEQDVRDTFEVMAGLEAQSGELAALRITDAQLAEIKALHYEMLAAYTRRELAKYYTLNAQIHSKINAAAANPVLSNTYAQLNARITALRFRSNQDEVKWKRAVDEHSAMLVALEKRDGTKLRALLTTHLHNKRDAVLELMRNLSSAAAAQNKKKASA
jgi:DNA-binding GntR family transcriptional regulator